MLAHPKTNLLWAGRYNQKLWNELIGSQEIYFSRDDQFECDIISTTKLYMIFKVRQQRGKSFILAREI